MSKWLIISMMVLVTTGTANAIDICNYENEPSDIPCMIISTWAYQNSCDTYNVTIWDDTPTLLDIRIMGDYGNTSRCNITFNYTTASSYTLNFTSGDSATVIVDADNQQYYLYIVLLVFIGILLLIGFKLEDGTFVTISGMLIVIMGIAIYNYGFPNLTNDFLINSVVVCLWGIGAYLTLLPAMRYYEVIG